jgi:dihydropteroate synthase
MIWKTLNIAAEEALAGTIALNTIALTKGADIIRVHDVKEAAQTVKLVKTL